MWFVGFWSQNFPCGASTLGHQGGSFWGPLSLGMAVRSYLVFLPCCGRCNVLLRPLLSSWAFSLLIGKWNGEMGDFSDGKRHLKMFLTKIVPRSHWTPLFEIETVHQACLFSDRVAVRGQEPNPQDCSLLPERERERTWLPMWCPNQCDTFLWLLLTFIPYKLIKTIPGKNDLS